MHWSLIRLVVLIFCYRYFIHRYFSYSIHIMHIRYFPIRYFAVRYCAISIFSSGGILWCLYFATSIFCLSISCVWWFAFRFFFLIEGGAYSSLVGKATLEKIVNAPWKHPPNRFLRMPSFLQSSCDVSLFAIENNLIHSLVSKLLVNPLHVVGVQVG